MSASLSVRIGAIAAAMTCWLLGSVVAAEIDATTGQPYPSSAREDATNRAGQLDRSQAQQPGPRPLRGQPYTANYRGAQTNSAQPGQEVDHYLANCLLKNNKAEVELGQFAEQQTQNPQVKQFAAQLVKDHQQLVQRLEQIAGAQATAGAIGSPSLDKNAATGTDGTTLGATGGAIRTPRSPGTDTATPPGTTSTAATDLDRNATRSLIAGNAANSGTGALGQLAAIEEKINERCNQALREELQQKSGAEFDECYVGSQIGGHMHMLAALEVISQESQGPLKQVADEARPIVQKHLEHAKQLAKQAKSGEQSSAQAQRTSTTSETQR
jgi:predicted outer membrane protein